MSDIVRPMMSEAPPKRRCHSPWLITTTRTLLLSSSSVKTRPSIGCTPSTLQKVQVTFRAGTCSGSPSPERRRVARLTRREIREDGIETAPLNPFCGRGVVSRRDVGLSHRVPDHHETVRIGVGQGADQHRVEGAEHRGNPADAERERCDRDRRERRIASDLPHSITHPARRCRARRQGERSERVPSPAPHRPLEAPPGGGLGGRRAVADLVGGGHLDERLQFIVQVGLDLFRLTIQRTMEARCRNITRPPAHS